MFKKLVLVLVLVLLTFASTSCQTVAGLGGDIKWTAEATADLIDR